MSEFMSKQELFDLFEQAFENRIPLIVLAPLVGASFSADNYNLLKIFLTRIDMDMPIIVRQFTNLDSSIPLPNNSKKFIPMKLLSCFFISGDMVHFFTEAQITHIYSTNNETEEKIEPEPDLMFISSEAMVNLLKK